MLEFLLLLTLFLRPLYSGLLLLLHVGVEKVPLSVLYIVVAAVDYVYLFTKHLFRYRVREKLWIAGIVMAILLVLQVVTGMQYSGLNGEYLSSILSFASLSIPAFLMGYALAEEKEWKRLGRVLPFFILSISAVVIYADLSTINTWNGLLYYSKLESVNIDYQNCTYYAAHALGLTSFYLIYEEEFHVGALVRKFRWIFWLLLPLQMFVVITAGGRGGFLLGVFLVAYFLVVLMIRYRTKPAYSITIWFLLFVTAIILIAYLLKKENGLQGFGRLTEFLGNPEDKIRSGLYGTALKFFTQKPILGNGVGAVWFTVGYYSHNMFCDLLCETGVIGTGAALGVLCWYAAKTWKVIYRNPVSQFGVIVFFFVFIMLQFSGYYLTEPMFWFALAYMFFIQPVSREEKNESIVH